MSKELHSAVVSPKGIWWVPSHGQEKRWIVIAFIWCLVLFAMMPIWHIKGGQNPTGIRSKVDPVAFEQRANRFIEDYKVGEEQVQDDLMIASSLTYGCT